MPHSLSQNSPNRDIFKHKPSSPHKHHTQHGNASRNALRSAAVARDAKSAILGLPAESLTHITSYLDPTALFVLSGVNRGLHQHVEDDNTWRRAYVYQFLGISPEGDIHDAGSPSGVPDKTLMLRREESSWQREFVSRWNIRKYVVS